MNKCKITILKTTFDEELAREYGAEGLAACPMHEVGQSLAAVIDSGVDMETFYETAQLMNPNANLIKGVICGHLVEEIEDPIMQKLRWLDKLIDELAKGKSMDKILRK